MSYFENKRILITGATSGIGYAITCVLARKPYKLVICGRNQAVLDRLKKHFPESITLALNFDVTDKAHNMKAASDIKKTMGGLDIAILNAGASESVNMQDFDSTVYERMMAVNYFSMVYAVEAFLPLLRQSQCPHLVGMSSIAGYTGLPSRHAYSSSKAASRNFLQGLRVDLLKEKMPVTTICPGFIKTALTDKNDFVMPFLMSADKAANIILNAIARKKQEVSFPKRMSLGLKIVSSLPNAWVTHIVRQYGDR
jgi:short-subunit dehydrogenase